MNPSRRQFLGTVAATGAALTVGVGAAAADDHTGDAALRVAHLSPDAPNVDVYVNGEKVLSDVPFGAVSDYLTGLAPDTYTVKVTAAGQPDVVAFEGDLTLEAKPYTVAAIGELTPDCAAEEAKAFEPLVLTDNMEPVPEDMARVRIVHASPDAPDVDVTVPSAGVKLADDLEYGTASEYVDVPAGDYTVEVQTADDEDMYDYATVELSVEGGKAYSAFAAGFFTPGNEDESDGEDPPAFQVIPAVDYVPEMKSKDGSSEESS
ncbi:DUF4397 domain-containing protein [Halobium salinum]|uniref:DUF4397 domain-containing protein n=1 Tax=Halobium salinum TaxID=1364940 RepID=A0ABD5P6V9_9EURY|nr:DUF4397 domain-containing protein [Halobium salinum]